MKLTTVQRLRWMAFSIVVLGALATCWLGFQRLSSDEMTGLELVGPVPTIQSANRTAEEPYEEYHRRIHNEWLSAVAEPTPDELAQIPGREFYRFSYQPTFHPKVIVSAWKDGDRCWIRTNVIEWDQVRYAPVRWERTRPLSQRNWNRLRALFLKHSVVDPLNGGERSGGLDGSTWLLESVVSGKVIATEISNPVRTSGIPRLQWIRAEPGLEDFVEACRLMLDWGKVLVPEMY